MIVFDLICDAHHVFEAWFGSSGDYEDQRKRGLLACPLCGSAAIEKAVMAPRVSAKGNRSVASEAPSSGSVDVALSPQAPPPAEIKAMMRELAKAQSEMLASSENVGAKFADEARGIHLGDRPKRAIHGRTTPDEARSLMEEGVPVAPLPFPIPPTDLDS